MFKIEGKAIIKLNINDREIELAVDPSDTLLNIIREKAGLTGTKPGCENGDCGLCTVLIDGWPIKSCLMLAVEAMGHKVTTIEGLDNAPIQKAFVENYGFQCGYCTSGFIMVCHALANIHPDAEDIVIEEWLQSNICRCTSYSEIKDAVAVVLNNHQ